MGKHRTSKARIEKREVTQPITARVSERSLALPAVSSLTIAPAAFPLTVLEAAGVSAVRRCVTLIANAIAGQKWTEWEEGVQITPVSRLVKRPAATFTRREWVWRVIASMALTDISHLFMTGGVDDEGVPGSLIPLPREAISPVGYSDPFGIFPPTMYRIAGQSRDTSAEYVIPIRSAFWPGVPPHLQGILEMARNTMLSARASDIYVSRYWQAGGQPTTVITTEQELNDTQADGIGNRWRDRRMKGPDFPAVLGKGAHAESWGADLSSALGIEARRDITVEIANLFGIPARYLNVVPVGQSQTYANLNDEALSLERFTLSGFIDPIEDAISDLLPGEREMQIDMTALTRAGQESRFRAWAIATGNKPWVTPQEVRTMESMPPNPEIDAPEPEPIPETVAPEDAPQAPEDAEVDPEATPEAVEA